MKKLMLVTIAALAVSCSKGGGGSSADQTAAAAIPANNFCAQSSSQYINPYTNGFSGGYGGYRGYSTGGFNAGFSINAGYGYNSYPGTGYNTGYGQSYNTYAAGYCSEQVTVDFCNVVMVNCGAGQNNVVNPYVQPQYGQPQYGQVQGQQLYSTTCKNQFQVFQNTHPNLSCQYNRYGVTGTLDNWYLQGQINSLSQMGY